MVLGCKRIHKHGWRFSKVYLAPPHKDFINGVANPELVYFILFKNAFNIDQHGWSKPVQHFIQRHVFAMLDEMLEWFAELQNL